MIQTRGSDPPGALPVRERLEALLPRVEKPGRYAGNEHGAVLKDPASVTLRFALAFPEVYEIAQSHLGIQILYDLLNRRPDVYAERVYAPWSDYEQLLRSEGLPLTSIETFTPLCNFDIVGFSLQYELTYTNILSMLDLGGIPLRAAERREEDPLIIAGGPCAFNAEPVAAFFDAILLGDGEEAIGEICDFTLAAVQRSRRERVEALTRVRGVYVPRLYAPRHTSGGRAAAARPVRAGQPDAVAKRVLRDLSSVPPRRTYVVPNLKVVHGRPSLEVMRGCVKGCRFCQAGYTYRPLREQDPRRVVEQAEHALAATGMQELTLLSLSTADYSCIHPVVTTLMNRLADRRIALSLPSTRVDAFAPGLLEQMRRVRKTSFTLAPEAGTQRMRDMIQKQYREEDLIAAAHMLFGLGWRRLKLYFLIGLPGETAEDLIGIADLSERVKKAGPRHVEVTASISTFVPKPHTPFQWAAQMNMEETEVRQAFLRRELGRRGIRFRWHDARASLLEGIFARGGRELAALLLAAYHLGCRFDGWTEACRFDLWQRAFAATGTDPRHYLRRRELDEALPWDHLDSGVNKAFLQRELNRANAGHATPDCSVEHCAECGVCDFKTIRNVTYRRAGAKGADHRGESIDEWAHAAVESDNTALGAWRPPGRAKTPAPDSRGAGGGRFRIRMTYRKLGRARFISMVEMVDLFIQALRRSGLPLAFTEGHHPKPRLRFSPGLPVGTESDCETLDVDFTEELRPADVAATLSKQLPRGLSVTSAAALSASAPAVEHNLTGFRYRVDLHTVLNGNAAGFDRKIARFLNSSRFPIHKRSRRGEEEFDARPFVTRLERTGSRHAELDIRFTPSGSVKVGDLLAAILGLDRPAARALPVRKIRCFYRDVPD